MIAHLLNNDNVVVNTIEVDSLDVMPNLISAEVGRIGWHLVDGVLVEPLIDLTVIRKPIIEAIKTERDRRKFNGVNVGGKWIHTDTYSRTQWMSMVMMGASIPSVQWTTMDLTTVTTSQALAGQVFQAVAALDAALFAHAGNLISQVLASNDPKSIDIMAGWSPTFGE